ncbi:peptide-methionine (S)-S-oxide reductase MsrA [Tundrisphaera sp. TA3]|uniref:peptide-methionine (S)-S-oxide reductase MsrA n=1 Tax=Tundrisphaera sp. TA3 TaxID=3435775 RepID=UPI003EB9DAA2
MALSRRSFGPLLASASLVWAAGLPLPRPASAQAPATSTPPAATAEPAAKPIDPEKAAAKPRPLPSTEVATFGAGCFWSTEAVFEQYKGVKSVTSGFSGGMVANPSYAQVCTGQTGHAEVVNIEFDPSVISYETLLKVYFHAHDPTTLNAQGDDYGPQYRSVIFYHGEEQKKAALAMYKDLTASRAFRRKIVTQLVPFQAFYPAEAYHQDYYLTNRGSQYTDYYIVPKLKKMSKLKLDRPAQDAAATTKK